MKYSVALVSVFVATAFAAPQGGSPLDVIPACAQSCALSNVGSSGCDISDLTKIAGCLCGKPDFQKAFADCVKNTSKCDKTTQCKLYTDSVAQCKVANPGTEGKVPHPEGTCPGDAAPEPTKPAPEPTTPVEPTTPAETTPAAEPSMPVETTPAAEPTAAEPTAAPVPTGNGTAPSVPEASSPSYSNNAGALAAKGGAAVLAVFVAVLAL